MWWGGLIANPHGGAPAVVVRNKAAAGLLLGAVGRSLFPTAGDHPALDRLPGA